MKTKTVFYCTECGNESAKWVGKCPACNNWNTMVEAEKPKKSAVTTSVFARKNSPKRMNELDTKQEARFLTGINELDRVLGGGAVRGSLVLIGGAPGIGKSTLLMQACGKMGKSEKILYVSGEESQRQLKMRAERLGVSGDEIYVLPETNLHEIISCTEDLSPDIVIIDSVQTLYNSEVSSAPGSVSQVRECTMSIMQMGKQQGITVFIVGHINKDGAIAGPKVLEHMVDCVLYFEGERSLSYRILRAAKNRFGSTNEIGVFEMLDTGLREVENPSEMLLSGRPVNTPGTCVACVMEGSRPMLAEIQALVAPTVFTSARRNSNGIDYNRALLLMAVLEKRGGLAVSGSDVYLNVIGGLELHEPASDLAAILAVASSIVDRPVNSDIAAVGEVGLTGEVRSVNALEQRLFEIARLGFKNCIIPEHTGSEFKPPKGLKLVYVKNVREAIAAALY